MLHQLRLIIEALPWTIPAFAGGAVLAILTMTLFPRRRTFSDKVGFALFVWCVLLALVVTLSPVKNSYFGVPTTGCNLSIWRPLSYHYWLSSGSRPPNVWLLMPASIGAMLIDGLWRRFLCIGFLVALPPGVEALQDLYPELKRSCSSQDIADNWTGLLVGLAIGTVLMLFIGLFRLARRRLNREHRAGVDPDAPRGRRYADNTRRETTDYDDALPLGGGKVGGYDDFGDFDDSPSSTRWWTPPENRAVPEGSGASDHTQILPPRGASPARRRDEAHPNQGPDDAPDSDTTQIIPRS